MMNTQLLDQIGVTVEKINYLYANMRKNRKNSRKLEFKLLKQYASELYEEVLALEIGTTNQVVETVPEDNLLSYQPKELPPQSPPIITPPPKTVETNQTDEASQTPIITPPPVMPTETQSNITETTTGATSLNHFPPSVEDNYEPNLHSEDLQQDPITFPELDTDILEGDVTTNTSDVVLPVLTDFQDQDQDQTTILPQTSENDWSDMDQAVTEDELKTGGFVPTPVFNNEVSSDLDMPLTEDLVKTEAATIQEVTTKRDDHKSKTKILDLESLTKTSSTAEEQTEPTEQTDTTPTNENDEVAATEEETVAMDMNSILAKHVRSAGSSVVDRLQRTVGRKDGGFDITFNQKHAFIRQLFNKNERAFYAALNDLGDSKGYIEALTYINLNLRHDYNWDDTDPVVQDFLDVIKRRFLS